MSLESDYSEKITLLQDRSDMLRRVRDFFYTKNFVEVDCNALNSLPELDLFIDPFEVPMPTGPSFYLHTSPEYGMKKLLSIGMKNIFQLSHVFRKEEEGKLHRNEFMMLEWYEVGISLDHFLSRVIDLISLFLDKTKVNILPYIQAFDTIGIDPYLPQNAILRLVPSLPREVHFWDKQSVLHYIWSSLVQPTLGLSEITIITEFPDSEAALAKTIQKDGRKIALRFEIYIEGMEIGNGYVELTDAEETKNRFFQVIENRMLHGKSALPLNTEFLQTTERGIPACCGIAIGFDRLMMLRNKKSDIGSVLPEIGNYIQPCTIG